MSTIAATEFLPFVATASAARDFIVVSLHDVAPSSRQIANTIISELVHRGVRVCSLLVVPDYHHEGLFTKDGEFVSWLRGLEADGHEIVIHGYFHERPRRTKETLRDKFLTTFYAQNEGEVYDLSYEEALGSIEAGQDEFRRQGLQTRGFEEPARYLDEGAELAAGVEPVGSPYSVALQCALGRMALPPIRFSRQLFGPKPTVRAIAQARDGLCHHHRPRYDRRLPANCAPASHFSQRTGDDVFLPRFMQAAHSCLGNLRAATSRD